MNGLEAETKQRLAKHKITILKRMIKDKETTGEYSGLNTEEKVQRQNRTEEKIRQLKLKEMAQNSK